MSTSLGQAIRETRATRGYSALKAAKLAGYSESYIRHLENGTRPATHEAVKAVDRALQAGGLLVDLYLAEEDGDDMRRREILSLLGTVVVAGSMGPLIAESARESLLNALSIDDWPEIANDYGRRFMTDTPNKLKARLGADLVVLRSAVTRDDGIGAQIAAPRLMFLQGMLLSNGGDAMSGARWYRAARLAADRTGNSELQQWVRGREAFRRGYEGTTPDEVLRMALGVDDVEAYLAVAQAYARIGESQLALTCLDQSRRVHEQAGSSDQTIYNMPEWRMALSCGYVYALLGDLQRAERELAAVKPPPYIARWEAQLELQRAVAVAASGDKTGVLLADSVVRTTPKEERSIVLSEMCLDAKRSVMTS